MRRFWGWIKASERPQEHPNAGRKHIPHKTKERSPQPTRGEDKPMKTSLRGALEIMSHEAIVLNRYKDSKGIWTIGVGITAAAGTAINPKTYFGTITADQAVKMFRNVLPKYEAYVDALLGGRQVKQHEYDALVSLAFNAGNINKPMTRKLARKGKIAEAINLWRADRILWPRRNKEVRLAETGQYNATHVTVYRADDYGTVLRRSGKRVPVEQFTGGGGGW